MSKHQTAPRPSKSRQVMPSPIVECRFCGKQTRVVSGTVLGAVSVELDSSKPDDRSLDRSKGHVPHYKKCRDYYNNRVGRIHARKIQRRSNG